MLESWPLVATLLVSLGGFTAGFIGAAVAQLGLRRIVRSLEYDVADLETRVVREVKLRAGKEGVKAQKAEQELFEQIQQQQPKSQDPWWMQYVSKDLRQ